MHTISRKSGEEGPACRLECYHVRDGGGGATVGLDVNRPHAAIVANKRDSGKFHILGVMAERLARAAGVTPVVIGPMGVFCGLIESPIDATVYDSPRVRANTLLPSAQPGLLGLDSTAPVESLVWWLAAEEDSLTMMCGVVDDDGAAPKMRRTAANRFALADPRDVFRPEELDPRSLYGSSPDVFDLSGLGAIPASVVVRVVTRGLYDARVAGSAPRTPWLLLDETRTSVGGPADPALRTLLTRGRAPGVSVVLATQHPSTFPEVAVSQIDLRVIRRLTASSDVPAMVATGPTYLNESFHARPPRGRGYVLVVDDTTETVHDVRVHPCETPDGGTTPRVISEPGSSEAIEQPL